MKPDYAREPGHLVLARVLLAWARPGPALGLLDRRYAAAVAQHRTGSLIEIGALRALARRTSPRVRAGRCHGAAGPGRPADQP
jgi:hypothetical protein